MTRYEVPVSETSWRVGDRIVRVYLGAHCVDEAWPWWHPWSIQTLVKEMHG